MERDDLDRLLAFINGLVDEKQKDKTSELFTGFEQEVTREYEANWLVRRIAQLENGDSVSVLAEVDGRIVANGDIARGHYSETYHHGELDLTVMGAYRGMGIGGEMVRTLLRFLSTNQAATHTYQKAGFKEAGRIPGKVYRNGKLFDSVIMARRI